MSTPIIYWGQPTNERVKSTIFSFDQLAQLLGVAALVQCPNSGSYSQFFFCGKLSPSTAIHFNIFLGPPHMRVLYSQPSFTPQVLCLCLGMCVHQFGVPSFCLQEHWREGYICLTFEHKYQWPFSRIPYSTFKAEMTVVTIATVGVFKIPPCSLYLFDSLRPVKLMSYIALSKMLTLQWKRPWNVHYFPFLQHSHIATCYNA